MKDVCPKCNGKGEIVVKNSIQVMKEYHLLRLTYGKCDKCEGTGIVNI
jgi:hypothetical protein